MDKTVVLSLNGHAGQFRLEGDAYDLLSQYFDRAAARLPADSDRAEVLGDLERSVGDKLVAKLGSEDRIVVVISGLVCHAATAIRRLTVCIQPATLV